MRNPIEITRAHDVLVGILTGQAPNPISGRIGGFSDAEVNEAITWLAKTNPKVSEIMQELLTRANCDVLCWVLAHDHNTTFKDHLANIETWLRGRGFTIEDQSN